MVFLYFRNDKRLILTHNNQTYTNENEFEQIKVVCEKFVDGFDMSKDSITVELHIIPSNDLPSDIVLLDLKQDEDVPSRLSDTVIINKAYTQIGGSLKFQIKVYDSEVIGKSSVAVMDIVQTLEIEDFMTDVQLTMLEQYYQRFINLAESLDKQLEEYNKFNTTDNRITNPYIEDKTITKAKLSDELIAYIKSLCGGGSDVVVTYNEDTQELTIE